MGRSRYETDDDLDGLGVFPHGTYFGRLVLGKWIKQ
jgi:hypothetical protein